MIFNIEQLSKDLKIKRTIQNKFHLRTASELIGISPSTISRVENKKLPDIESFGKICIWLEIPPNNYFNLTQKTLQNHE